MGSESKFDMLVAKKLVKYVVDLSKRRKTFLLTSWPDNYSSISSLKEV
jgi:hypothetical protein